MSEQFVVGKAAFTQKSGLILDSNGETKLVGVTPNGITRFTNDEILFHVYKRVNFPVPGEDGYDAASDYDVAQAISKPVKIAEDGSTKDIALALKALYDEVTKTRKPLICNFQVGSLTYPIRHSSDGKVHYSSVPHPYGVNDSSALGFGFYYDESGAIPLFIDSNVKPKSQVLPLSISQLRFNNYINLTDGASHTFTFPIPIELARLYIPCPSTLNTYDALVLDFEAVNDKGETFTGKLRKTNYLFYGLNVFSEMGAISSIKLEFKTSSQHKHFKSRYSVFDGKFVDTVAVPAGATSAQATPITYVQLYALNGAKLKAIPETGLTDLTGLYAVAAGSQPAAKAGTSVADLISAAPAVGWEAANVNQAGNAFGFAAAADSNLRPRFVDIEFYNNAALASVTSIAVATGMVNSADTANSGATSKLAIDSASLALDSSGTTTVRVQCAASLEDFEGSNKLSVAITETNATVAMKIKSIRIYG